MATAVDGRRILLLDSSLDSLCLCRFEPWPLFSYFQGKGLVGSRFLEKFMSREVIPAVTGKVSFGGTGIGLKFDGFGWFRVLEELLLYRKPTLKLGICRTGTTFQSSRKN